MGRTVLVPHISRRKSSVANFVPTNNQRYCANPFLFISFRFVPILIPTTNIAAWSFLWTGRYSGVSEEMRFGACDARDLYQQHGAQTGKQPWDRQGGHSKSAAEGGQNYHSNASDFSLRPLNADLRIVIGGWNCYGGRRGGD